MSQLEDSVLEHPAPEAPAIETRQAVHGVVAAFAAPEALLEAIRALRERGYEKLEAYTPFPVHGLEEALGIRRSKLGWLVAILGALGALTGLLLQWWVGFRANPFVIGGKPLFSLVPSIPIVFELAVLFAAFGAVFGMLFANGLPRLYHPLFTYSQARRATDDRFLLVIEAGEGEFDAEEAAEALAAAGGRHMEVLTA